MIRSERAERVTRASLRSLGERFQGQIAQGWSALGSQVGVHHEVDRRSRRSSTRVAVDEPRAVDQPQFEPALVRRATRIVLPIMRAYFRAEVRGLENVPERQTLIIANHDGGMLPLDGPLLVSLWHEHFGYKRPVQVLIHDMLMKLFGPGQDFMRRCGCLRADRHNLEAALDAGHDVMVYPGGSFEAYRSFRDRKTLTLGHRTGFVRHALRRRLPITPVVSVGVHETLLVVARGDWLAERLGLTRRFRADVFPLVAGLPFGLWFGALFPHLPLPAKITMQVLPPIDLYAEVSQRLGRDLRESDLVDEALIERCFDRVRGAMQREMDRLYAARRFPVIG